MARFAHVSLALVLAGCVALPVRAGDVAGWIDHDVNAALAEAEHTFAADCADLVELAATVDCEVNTALAVHSSKGGSSEAARRMVQAAAGMSGPDRAQLEGD
jgi:hypothetical protein